MEATSFGSRRRNAFSSLALIFLALTLSERLGKVDTISPCGRGRFWCTNNICIYSSRVCNGRNDCGDQSDERSCSESCGPDNFFCKATSICIKPELVCDRMCDCGIDCQDEDDNHCYRRSGRYFSPLGLGFSMAIILGVISCYGIYQVVRGKICRQNTQQASVRPQRNTVLDNENDNNRPDLLDDLPPAYDSVMNNSMFIIDAESLNEENVEPLPSYDDAISPGAFQANPSADLTHQPPPPSYDSVKLPSWVSNRESNDTSTTDRSYNVVYYNRSPRLQSARNSLQNNSRQQSHEQSDEQSDEQSETSNNYTENQDRTDLSTNSENSTSNTSSNVDPDSSSDIPSSAISNTDLNVGSNTDSNDSNTGSTTAEANTNSHPESNTNTDSIQNLNISSNADDPINETEDEQTSQDSSSPPHYDNHAYELDDADQQQIGL